MRDSQCIFEDLLLIVNVYSAIASILAPVSESFQELADVKLGAHTGTGYDTLLELDFLERY